MNSPRRKRPVRIHNGYPRLRLNARAIAAVIHFLDKEFEFPPSELKFLNRRAAATPPKSRITSQQQKIEAGVPPGELSVAFLTDAALIRLHTTFLNDRRPTDVITFAGAPHLGQAGEICVSVDTARAYSARHDHAFSEELTLYLVHGWLHLTGYEDLSPTKKRRMRAAEARAMKLLSAANKIPVFVLV